jgi:hypothetical protein
MEKNYKRELTLKSNSVKRLLKEWMMYESEFQKLSLKYEEMKKEANDEYGINKQNEYMQETISVMNSIKSKLRTSTDELTILMNEIDTEDIKNTEEYKNAEDLQTKAKEFFENHQ